MQQLTPEQQQELAKYMKGAHWTGTAWSNPEAEQQLLVRRVATLERAVAAILKRLRAPEAAQKRPGDS
jgi:hypothetical protein